eukprot:scaffold2314_cov267-Pinguiococcus_pyrenoidosus.AAC.12
MQRLVQAPEHWPSFVALVHVQREKRASRVDQQSTGGGGRRLVIQPVVDLPPQDSQRLRREGFCVAHSPFAAPASRALVRAAAQRGRAHPVQLLAHDVEGVGHLLRRVAAVDKWLPGVLRRAPYGGWGFALATAPVVCVQAGGLGVQVLQIEHVIQRVLVAVDVAPTAALHAVERHAVRQHHLSAEQDPDGDAVQERQALIRQAVANVDAQHQWRQAIHKVLRVSEAVILILDLHATQAKGQVAPRGDLRQVLE